MGTSRNGSNTQGATPTEKKLRIYFELDGQLAEDDPKRKFLKGAQANSESIELVIVSKRDASDVQAILVDAGLTEPNFTILDKNYKHEPFDEALDSVNYAKICKYERESNPAGSYLFLADNPDDSNSMKMGVIQVQNEENRQDATTADDTPATENGKLNYEAIKNIVVRKITALTYTPQTTQKAAGSRSHTRSRSRSESLSEEEIQYRPDADVVAPAAPAPAPAPAPNNALADPGQLPNDELNTFNAIKNHAKQALNRRDLSDLLKNHKRAIANKLNEPDANPGTYQDKLAELANCTKYADLEKLMSELGLPANEPSVVDSFMNANRQALLKTKLMEKEDSDKKIYNNDPENKHTPKQNTMTLARLQTSTLTNQLDRIRSLEDWAASAPYLASRVSDTAKLNQCAESAYALKLTLEQMKQKNEIHRDRCAQRKVAPAHKDKTHHYQREEKNAERRIKEIDNNIKRLNATIDNISLARSQKGRLKNETAYFSSMGDAATLHEDAGDNKAYQLAEYAIQDFFSEGRSNENVSSISTASTLQTKTTLQIKQAKSIVDTIHGVRTGAIQTTFKDGNKDLHRQDFFIHPDQMEHMTGRQGFGANRLPSDTIMLWAIKGVSNYQAFATSPDKMVTINAGNMSNECIEGLMIVCKARGLEYAVTGRMIETNIEKLVEKAVKRYDILAARSSVAHSDRLHSTQVVDEIMSSSPSRKKP